MHPRAVRFPYGLLRVCLMPPAGSSGLPQPESACRRCHRYCPADTLYSWCCSAHPDTGTKRIRKGSHADKCRIQALDIHIGGHRHQIGLRKNELVFTRLNTFVARGFLKADIRINHPSVAQQHIHRLAAVRQIADTEIRRAVLRRTADIWNLQHIQPARAVDNRNGGSASGFKRDGLLHIHIAAQPGNCDSAVASKKASVIRNLRKRQTVHRTAIVHENAERCIAYSSVDKANPGDTGPAGKNVSPSGVWQRDHRKIAARRRVRNRSSFSRIRQRDHRIISVRRRVRNRPSLTGVRQRNHRIIPARRRVCNRPSFSRIRQRDHRYVFVLEIHKQR